MSSAVLEILCAASGAAFVASLVGAAVRPHADSWSAAAPTPGVAPNWLRVLRPILAAISLRLAPLAPRPLRAQIDRLLARAGSPLGLDVDGVMALSCLSLLAGAAVAIALFGALGIAGVAALATVGGAYPAVWLSGRGRARLTSVDRSLAYANDLLVLSLEAGSDLVGAVRQVVQRSSITDPLGAEFARLLRDLELGSTRRAALEALAARAPSDVVKAFVASMIQAEQRGTPLAQALRVQSGALRSARSQQIETHANRAAVLVMLPLLLIFCATLLLLFGGVVVRAMRGELL